MNLVPDEDQREIAAAAAAFLGRELTVGSEAVDAVLWRRMAELGWLSLGVASEVGGAGYTLVEESVLHRELGRYVAPGPFVASTLACQVAAGAGELDLLSEIASGRSVAALAEAHRDPEAVVGESVTGRYRLLDSGGAALLLAMGPGGAAIVDATGVTEWRGYAGLDPSTGVATARFAGVPALAFLPAGAGAGAGLANGSADARGSSCGVDIRAYGSVLVAAQLVGICEATRDESVRYASTREQFGRPIGSFQAVKHRCADMAVRAGASASLTFLAALCLRDGDADAARLVPLAKALASEYAVASAADNIQNHGGTGFTAACSAHLYLKRASVLSGVFGTPAQLWTSTIRSGKDSARGAAQRDETPATARPDDTRATARPDRTPPVPTALPPAAQRT